jgi:endoglycosylceramidase
MRFIAAAVLLLACLSHTAWARDTERVCGKQPPTGSAPPAPDVHSDGTYFRGSDGRYVMLRGVNASGNGKVPPFRSFTSAQQLDPLPAWGINVLRLLFTWEAYEPAPCQFDDGYLDDYERAVTWAAQRGIDVIVDFHQDGYSRYALGGCGDGAPLWALTPRLAPAVPDNGADCRNWGLTAMLSPQNYEAFARFFDNDNDAYRHFIGMAGRVAARMASHRNVIGYDLLNEPWADATALARFYRDAGAAIRARHPGAMLLFEPALPLYGMLLPVGRSTIAPPPFANEVFAPHYYDPEIYVLGTWTGVGPEATLDRWKQQTDEWRLPLLLGEFGIPEGAGNGADYLNALYRWMDRNLVSGTQWNYDPGWTEQLKDGWNEEDFSIVDDRLQLRPGLFAPRPYPQKTAGRPLRFRRSGGGLSYTWINDPRFGNGATELYLPPGYMTDKTWRSLPEDALHCSDAQPMRLVCSDGRRGIVTLLLVPSGT